MAIFEFFLSECLFGEGVIGKEIVAIFELLRATSCCH